MSFEYWFESDLNLDQTKLREIALQLGVQISSNADEELELYFDKSDMIAWCEFPKDIENQIKSEESGGIMFNVGCRCIFRFNTNLYEQKLFDMESFLNSVYKHTKALFIVSFQLESLHYINKGVGVGKCY